MIAAREAPGASSSVTRDASPLRCRTCQRTFDFDSGETAIVMRHVAFAVAHAGWERISASEQEYFMYLMEVDRGPRAFSFVHGGGCAAAASTWTWAETSSDCSALGRDPERLRILDAWPGNGCPDRIPNDGPLHVEPLVCWAQVQHQDGSRRIEGITRPGGMHDEFAFLDASAESLRQHETDGPRTALRVLATRKRCA